jgi:hypothetical protein
MTFSISITITTREFPSDLGQKSTGNMFHVEFPENFGSQLVIVFAGKKLS